MTDFAGLLRALAERHVEFVLVGGAAAIAHGSARHTVTIHVFGIRCLCLTLERLIQVKRAAGRPKDLAAIAELEALLEERGRSGEA